MARVVRSMMIEACRFHNSARRLQRMAFKATGIVIHLKAKLLIVSDSVMGYFFKRRGMGDASSGAVSYIGYCAPCSGNTAHAAMQPQHTNAGRQLRWFFPPATRLVLP